MKSDDLEGTPCSTHSDTKGTIRLPRPVDGLVPFADLIMGDPRNQRIPPDALRENLAEMRLSPAAPEVVRHEVRTAKQVFMSAWFFYELFADAIHHCAVACEAALRERFLADLALPGSAICSFATSAQTAGHGNEV